MQSIIEINNISLKVGEKDIIKDFSLIINKGETLSLLGINGSGKTSLLSLILGDQKISSGEIKYIPTEKKIFESISPVYDNQLIFPQLKVKEVIHFFAIGYKVNFKKYAPLMTSFGLDALNNSYVKELSQGERVKVNIFTALLQKPELLVMDEPFAAIDPTIKGSLWRYIKQYSSTIIYTTHDWDSAEAYSDRLIFMKDGKILHRPFTKDEIYNIAPSKKKIVVQNTANSLTISYDYYNSNENMGFVFFNEEKLKEIKKQTLNFSIMAVSLKDIYHYLSNLEFYE